MQRNEIVTVRPSLVNSPVDFVILTVYHIQAMSNVFGPDEVKGDLGFIELTKSLYENAGSRVKAATTRSTKLLANVLKCSEQHTWLVV